MAGEAILKNSKGGAASVNTYGELIVNNGSGTTCCCLPCPDGNGVAYLNHFLVTFSGIGGTVGACTIYGVTGSYLLNHMGLNASFCVPYYSIGNFLSTTGCNFFSVPDSTGALFDLDQWGSPNPDTTCYGPVSTHVWGWTIELQGYGGTTGEFFFQAGFNHSDGGLNGQAFSSVICNSFTIGSGGTATFPNNMAGCGSPNYPVPIFDSASVTVTNVSSC